MGEIAERYLQLDPRPGATLGYGSRGAPGFGSRSPASDHVISLRDPRSSPIARVWLGSDGRVHEEQVRPPLSVHGELCLLAWTTAEHRGVDGPSDRDDVFALLRFVDRHLDHITRHADLAVEAHETLRNLAGVLRPVTGDGTVWVGSCPNVVEQDEIPSQLEDAGVPASDEPIPVRCDAPLRAPRLGDSITCAACGRVYPMDEWLSLGTAMNEAGANRMGQSA